LLLLDAFSLGSSTTSVKHELLLAFFMKVASCCVAAFYLHLAPTMSFGEDAVLHLHVADRVALSSISHAFISLC
jgi:hypothetical protein